MELPRSAPPDVIEDLRRLAESSALEMYPHAETISDTIEGEAADLIEAMVAAFRQIKNGEGDPVEIASAFVEDDPVQATLKAAAELAPGNSDS